MSTVFVDLSDSLIQSDILQQDATVGQNLVTATSKFITLAKSAIDERDNAIDEATKQVSMSSDRRGSTSQQRPISKDSSNSVHVRTSSPAAPISKYQIPEDFDPVPDTLLKKEVFGNGWFGLQPAVLSQLSPKSGDMGRLDTSFGVKLLRTTLSVAYEYLMDANDSYSDIIMNMYRFALIYHTKQE